jgi:polysaccharide export outer membrane protein
MGITWHSRGCTLPGSSLVLILAALIAGCATTPELRLAQLEQSVVPRELDKVTLPAYIVEPPDILVIESVTVLRQPGAPLRPGDRLNVQLRNGLPIDLGVDPESNPAQYNAELQIELDFKLLAGSYQVGSDGSLDFGPSYGKVAVANLTVPEAETRIREHLQRQIGLKSPELKVSLEDIEAPQVVSGEHLVRPDGRVSLGIYGEAYVAGMTLMEAKAAIEHQLSEYILVPQVSVDVMAYNSKNYYVILDGGGFGEQVIRLPFTGNETVLDAIAQIQGLSQVSSKRIWIARPAPAGTGRAQILEVSWEDVAALGQTATNYQLLPGDRIYVQADHMIAADNFIAKVVAPIERVFGVTLLGFGVVRSSHNLGASSANNNGGGFF